MSVTEMYIVNSNGHSPVPKGNVLLEWDNQLGAAQPMNM